MFTNSLVVVVGRFAEANVNKFCFDLQNHHPLDLIIVSSLSTLPSSPLIDLMKSI